ncbi:MAG: hypothetical protein RUMPE_00591 [Eubacteriales bacterium SKADARSKE-1]|nr:hypothetical protein [Eubacteriales bacterium SKADARSKE-1]
MNFRCLAKKVICFLFIFVLFQNGTFSNLKVQAKDINQTRYEYYKNLPPDKYSEELKAWYKRLTKSELNLENPTTYNEKIQWLKLYDSTPIKTKLADKYLVRDWVKEKIGEEYLVPLLGVWDKFDDINFDKLPDKFVLKCNHGSGWNIVVTDKSNFNKAEAKKKFDTWINTNYAFRAGLELQYKNMKPKIIAEEYMENDGGDLYDYKVWCNNGRADFIMYLSNRKNGLKMSFYDTKWNLMPFTYTYPQHENLLPKPANLNKILDLATKLSEGFAHARVDFYRLNDGTLKFGEITFTSASGSCKFDPPEYNKILGDLIELPKEKYDYHKLFENK